MQHVTGMQGNCIARERSSQLSSVQRRLLDAMAQAPLQRFRRGWAHDRFGPFFKEDSIIALARRDMVRITASGRYAKLRSEPPGQSRQSAAPGLGDI
ncbi:hypothetical protein [Bosea sp. OK403]|uniref:hypothetical protein n=1 Tax=Bosea sp. OK403 TaxID=1855286 RepID=UPI0011144090|nr:hypothetical protein [Bosea sp. OK403]